MSHSIVRETACRNADVIERTCRKVGAEFLGPGQHQVYTRQAKGVGIKLPSWQQPIVFDLETGKAVMDNYRGTWGNIDLFHSFCQQYAVEATHFAFEKQGKITEQVLPSGEIELVVTLNEGTQAAATPSSQLFAESSR